MQKSAERSEYQRPSTTTPNLLLIHLLADELRVRVAPAQAAVDGQLVIDAGRELVQAQRGEHLVHAADSLQSLREF